MNREKNMTVDKDAQNEIEHVVPEKESTGPAAGPHAKDRLTDYSKTPGTGALPDDQGRDVDVGSD